jgi:hypothetical protein
VYLEDQESQFNILCLQKQFSFLNFWNTIKIVIVIDRAIVRQLIPFFYRNFGLNFLNPL